MQTFLILFVCNLPLKLEVQFVFFRQKNAAIRMYSTREHDKAKLSLCCCILITQMGSKVLFSSSMYSSQRVFFFSFCIHVFNRHPRLLYTHSLAQPSSSSSPSSSFVSIARLSVSLFSSVQLLNSSPNVYFREPLKYSTYIYAYLIDNTHTDLCLQIPNDYIMTILTHHQNCQCPVYFITYPTDAAENAYNNQYMLYGCGL